MKQKLKPETWVGIFLIAGIPVSYTHLDVYKRQGPHLASRDADVNVLHDGSILLVAEAHIAELHFPLPGSVSYTHLTIPPA